MKSLNILLIILFFLLSTMLIAPSVSAQQAQVRAILFFSDTCGHCHAVITELLPPLAEKYGDQLLIGGVNVSNEVGQFIYRSAIERFDIPDNRLGVPTLIIGETVLVGSVEIPERLPGLIESGLENGGVDWPDIPGLKEIMANQPDNTQQSTPQGSTSTNTQVESAESESAPQDQLITEEGVFIDRFKQDPIGNSFSIVVLIGMIASVIGVGYSSIKGDESDILDWPNWVIPVISIIGLGVAGYLAYVEVTASTAICGPVGDCNTVQESAYARLFGILHIGVLGVVGYIAILIIWTFQYYGPESLRKFSTFIVWGMAWFGVLFSIYLTFLEPFVIGATCAWCLTSAIIMTIILLASTEPAKQALQITNDEFYDDNQIEEEY